MEILNNLLGGSTNTAITLTIITTWVLVQVIKPLLGTHTKYIPLLAVVVGGICGAVIADVNSTDILTDIVLGVVCGFASTGLNETFTKSFTSVLSASYSKLSDFFTSKTSTDSESTTSTETTTESSK